MERENEYLLGKIVVFIIYFSRKNIRKKLKALRILSLNMRKKLQN